LPWQLLRRAALPAAVLALLSDFVALLALIGVMRELYALSLSLSAYPGAIGGGLYLTFIGALVAFVAGIWPASNNAPDHAAAAQGGPARLDVLIVAALAGIFPLTCACAILAGVLIGPVGSALQPGGGAATVQPTPGLSSPGLLATPLIDVQVTLWSSAPPTQTLTTPPPTQTLATPTENNPHLAAPTIAATPAPVSTPAQVLPTAPLEAPTREPAPTSTPVLAPTATPPVSLLATPTPGP
jgi:hypothetical protein